MNQRILILGGGFGGLFTALGLGGKQDVTLVSEEDHFLFKPMLYEYLSGEVEAWHIAPNYKELLDASVRVVRGTVSSIDLNRHSLSVAGQKQPLIYEVLVLALLVVANYGGFEGPE